MRRAKYFWIGGCFSVAAFVGCSHPFRSADEVAQARREVIYTYQIAHGMVESYALDRYADPARIAQLQKLDQQALQAVQDLEQHPDREPDTASQEVQALVAAASRS